MKGRILAVEDSATQAEALRALLEEQDYDVTMARSGELALERLAEGEFDLVLSDVMMPGITGYDLARRIKQNADLARLPVVLLTSLNDPMDIVRGLECGADNYITKPYDPQHLLARVRHVLDNQRLRRHSKTSMGVTVHFMGRDLTITSDREQILDLFISSVEDVVRANEALQVSQRELADAHARLEEFAKGKDREARVSSDRYRALLQNMGDAVFVLDLNGKIVDLNPRAVDLIERPDASIGRETLLDLLGEEERRALEAGLRTLAGGTRTWHAEGKLEATRGRNLWCELTASRSESDGEALVLLIVRDVTNRREAEETIRLRERQLTEAQRIAKVGSYERNLATDEYVWSEELYRILGRDPEEHVTHEEFLRQIEPDDREIVAQTIRDSARSGEPFTVEFRMRGGDGIAKIVQGRGWVVADATGGPYQVKGTLQDITERKEAERAWQEREAAERANRAKSEFLSRMSHELRTPLNGILGFGQLLAMDELSASQQESVEQILRGGHHLLQLINEVLDLSTIEAGRLSISLEPVALGQIVSEALDLLRPLADQLRITLSTSLPRDGADYVEADAQRLRQVILNLVSNGIKYNRSNGRVTIEAEEVGDQRIRIAVRDTGAGLRPEEVQKLFFPFERLGVEAREIEGTGLGLMLTKRLVEVMGGAIGVDSEPGQGTAFWFELLRAEPPPDFPNAPAAERPTPVYQLGVSTTKTILYIEDNLSNLRLVERLLDKPGIRMLTAMKGTLGIDLARNHKPDLILLDLNLPDMSGEQVIRQLHSDPDLLAIPVVILSADAMPGQTERLMGAGAEAFITKPLDVPHFLEVVFKLLQEAAR